MRNVIRTTAVTMLLVLSVPFLMAQAGPISGTAVVGLISTSAKVLTPGARVPLSLRVDLTGVQGISAFGSVTPAVLGGYVMEITYDPTRLRLESIAGGKTPEFAGAPVYTNLTRANSDGRVRIAAAQTSSSGPSGLVEVAELTFTSITGTPVLVDAKPISLSSALQGPGVGPTSILGRGMQQPITFRGIREQ
jgi:hypothetical protein